MRFLGCKVSQADAALIRDALLEAGHREAPPERAEVHVLNTCALTREAERKSRKEAARAGRRPGHRHTFVAGCAVNLNAAQFSVPQLAGADVSDAASLTTIPGSADRAAIEIVARLGGPLPACADDAPAPASTPTPGRTRAFLKVQNGCDSGCAFCIIPTTRGRAESRPLARVLADARRRLFEGHPELVLTGINIGTWRGPDGAGLPELVRAVGRMPGLARLRISSIEPSHVTEALLEAMAGTPTVAPHLHVPLQSGSDRVLAAMRRSHSAADYLRAARRARAALPGLNLTTDAIVGFPGEAEGDLAATAEIAESLAMGKIHVFPYSARPGTPAAQAPLAEAVPPDVIRERGRRLRELSDRLGARHRASRVGGHDEVLIETERLDGTLSGLGRDYCRFTLPAGSGRPGQLVPVAVAGVAGDHLEGRLLP